MPTYHDFSGIMAMLPAFATDEARNYSATGTVNTDELTRAVDSAIADGIGFIATTGSFGEFHTLLPKEWSALVDATVQAANGRVPVVAGCPDVNARVAIERARLAVDIGADGVLMGIPFYFPSTIDNAVGFLREAAEAVSGLAFVFYHNPVLHKIEMPAEAFGPLVDELPNLVAMKDGNRDPRSFTELIAATKGQVSVFSAAWQYDAYRSLGAAGFWSYDVWMDPLPHVALLEAVNSGDHNTARSLTIELHPSAARPSSLSWRETLAKLAIADAGYCNPGPLRPPFTHIPTEIRERAKKRAESWIEVADGLRRSPGWSDRL